VTELEIVQVRLRELPVPVWARTQQATDELLREFALASAAPADEHKHPLPARLTALIASLTERFAGVSSEQEQQLFDAADAGVPVIPELVFTVPAEAAAASRALGDMLDEADDYCRAGRHLLTLAAPDEVVAFRRWYLSEFIRQTDGEPPVPWSRYDGWWPEPT
jgi:hypothetical protein